MNTRIRGASLAAPLLAFLAAIPALAAAEDAETARLIQDLGIHESAVAVRERPGWAAPRKVVVMGADAARAGLVRCNLSIGTLDEDVGGRASPARRRRCAASTRWRA